MSKLCLARVKSHDTVTRTCPRFEIFVHEFSVNVDNYLKPSSDTSPCIHEANTPSLHLQVIVNHLKPPNKTP
jgi:hypothetical protein